MIDLVRGSSSRLTFEGAAEANPVWSKDGEWVYYSSVAAGKAAIRRKRASGVGGEEVVVERPSRASPTSISPDGRKLLFGQQGQKTNFDIFVLDLETREVSPVLSSPFVEVFARFGPTADWITYMSDDTGRMEVYVQKITGAGGRWQISTNGGRMPVWSRDGRKLYYLTSGSVEEVDMEAGESLTAGIPRQRFSINYRGGPIRPYDLTSDGKRFVFVLAEQSATAKVPMSLVQNWTHLLRR